MKKNNKNGFTLIELIMVMIIVVFAEAMIVLVQVVLILMPQIIVKIV